MPRFWLAATLAFGATLNVQPSLAAPFYAPPAPSDDAPVFTGQAELGYTRLTGNTDSETLLAKGRLTWLTGNWTHSLRGETFKVEEHGESSAERYLFAGRERYDLQGPHYLFGFLRWEKDRFSGYRYQTTTIVGYGRQVLTGPLHTLSLETGPGYRHDALATGEAHTLFVGYGALDYQWEISEGTRFQQELSVEGTHKNITTRAFSAVTTQLNASLSLRVSHEAKNNSDPPSDAEKHTDRITAVSLLYNW